MTQMTNKEYLMQLDDMDFAWAINGHYAKAGEVKKYMPQGCKEAEEYPYDDCIRECPFCLGTVVEWLRAERKDEE